MTALSKTRRETAWLFVLLLSGLVLTCLIGLYTHAGLPIATLCRNPQRYAEKTVIVYGMVEQCEQKISQRGHPYYTFSLRDGAHRVTIFAFGNPHISDREIVTVKGVYHQVKHIGPWTIHHEIDATYGAIMRGETRPMMILRRLGLSRVPSSPSSAPTHSAE